jgi:hypothetical protein
MALSKAEVADILRRYPGNQITAETSYATVRDFCDSADHLPQITSGDGDLKNVQRPWAVKTLLRCIPPPARLLEIGAGEPAIASFLQEFGYEVTVVDPYDGSGRGPVEFEKYQHEYPKLHLVRDYMRRGLAGVLQQEFDAVFSISVLEHLSSEALDDCFAGIDELLRKDAVSVHCFDFVVRGLGEEHDRRQAQRVLAAQANLCCGTATAAIDVATLMDADVETFYLSAQGHQWWRCGRSYDDFPYRKVGSLQTITRRAT